MSRAVFLIAVSVLAAMPTANQCLAAPVNWAVNASGLWSDPANWSSNPALPGAADAVTISRAAANPVITHASGNHTIASLLCNDALLMSGGDLTVTGLAQVNGLLTLTGGTIHSDTSLEITTLGEMRVEASGSIDSQLDNSGLLVHSGGSLFISNHNLVNGGSLQLVGEGGLISFAGGQLYNFGTLLRDGLGTTELHLVTNNVGLFEVRSGILNLTSTLNHTEGELRLSGGSIAGGSIINALMNSIVTGSGEIAATVNISGHLSPGIGVEAAELHVAGILKQFSTSVTSIEIGGALPSDYDHVSAGGAMTNAGTLNVNFINDFMPQANDEFVLFTGAPRVGLFSTMNLPSLPPPLRWERVVTNQYMLWEVMLPGDTNCDGVLDGDDIQRFVTRLINVQAGFQNGGPCKPARADMNDDGVVNGDDITLFIDALLS